MQSRITLFIISHNLQITHHIRPNHAVRADRRRRVDDHVAANVRAWRVQRLKIKDHDRIANTLIILYLIPKIHWCGKISEMISNTRNRESATETHKFKESERCNSPYFDDICF